MDGIDARIIAALHDDPLASYEALGRTMGLSGTAVKRRHARLEAEGVLQGIALMPRPHCFDRQQLVLHFRPGQAPSPADRLLDLPEVYFVKRAHDGATTLIAALAEGEEELVQIATEAFGAPPHSCTRLGPPTAPPSAVLSPIDWTILRVWVERPRTTVVTLAERAGLTVKTVRRRRRSLLDSGAIQVLPLVDATGSSGVIFYGLSIHTSTSAALQRVLRALQASEHFVSSQDPDAGTAYVWGHARTFAEVTRIEQDVTQREGVKAAHLSVPAGMVAHTPRILHWIEERLHEWRNETTHT